MSAQASSSPSEMTSSIIVSRDDGSLGPQLTSTHVASAIVSARGSPSRRASATAVAACDLVRRSSWGIVRASPASSSTRRGLSDGTVRKAWANSSTVSLSAMRELGGERQPTGGLVEQRDVPDRDRRSGRQPEHRQRLGQLVCDVTRPTTCEQEFGTTAPLIRPAEVEHAERQAVVRHRLRVAESRQRLVPRARRVLNGDVERCECPHRVAAAFGGDTGSRVLVDTGRRGGQASERAVTLGTAQTTMDAVSARRVADGQNDDEWQSSAGAYEMLDEVERGIACLVDLFEDQQQRTSVAEAGESRQDRLECANPAVGAVQPRS